MRGEYYLVACLLGGDCQDGISQIGGAKVGYCLVVRSWLAKLMLDPLSGMINGVGQLVVGDVLVVIAIFDLSRCGQRTVSPIWGVTGELINQVWNQAMTTCCVHIEGGRMKEIKRAVS